MREAFVQARNYQRKRARGDEECDLRWEILADILEGKIPARCHAHRADDILTALRVSREFGFRLTIEHCTEGHRVAGELTAARVLGLEERLGSLDLGKDADCFIADGDLLDPRTRVLTTIVGGQVAWSLQDAPRL